MASNVTAIGDIRKRERAIFEAHNGTICISCHYVHNHGHNDGNDGTAMATMAHQWQLWHNNGNYGTTMSLLSVTSENEKGLGESGVS